MYTVLCACSPTYKFKQSTNDAYEQLNVIIHASHDAQRIMLEQVTSLVYALRDAPIKINITVVYYNIKQLWHQYDKRDGDLDHMLFATKKFAKNTIHIFIVDEIATKHTVGEFILKYNKRKAKYEGLIVILNDNAADGYTHPTTLAHEIGHMFCLNHVDDDKNIMMSGDRIVNSSFTEKQIIRLIKNIRRKT